MNEVVNPGKCVQSGNGKNKVELCGCIKVTFCLFAYILIKITRANEQRKIALIAENNSIAPCKQMLNEN